MSEFNSIIERITNDATFLNDLIHEVLGKSDVYIEIEGFIFLYVISDYWIYQQGYDETDRTILFILIDEKIHSKAKWIDDRFDKNNIKKVIDDRIDNYYQILQNSNFQMTKDYFSKCVEYQTQLVAGILKEHDFIFYNPMPTTPKEHSSVIIDSFLVNSVNSVLIKYMETVFEMIHDICNERIIDKPEENITIEEKGKILCPICEKTVVPTFHGFCPICDNSLKDMTYFKNKKIYLDNLKKKNSSIRSTMPNEKKEFNKIRRFINDSADPYIINLMKRIYKGEKIDSESHEKALSIMKSNPRLYREIWTKVFGSNAYSTKEEQDEWLGKKEELSKQVLLKELEFVEKIYKNSSFYVIKDILAIVINKDSETIIKMLNKSDRTVREYFHSMIGNSAGDLLESGRYHVYRGALDVVGQDLLSIFDKSYDYLLAMKAKDIDKEYAIKQKQILRDNIKYIG